MRVFLFDLAFLVDYVFTDHRIKFLHFHLVRHVAFVFCSRVVVTGAGRRYEFDFIACAFCHGLYPDTLCTQVGQHFVYAVFVNNTQTMVTYP